MKKILNYINGDLLPPISNDYFDNINPSIGKAYSLIPNSDARDVDLAVIAAKNIEKQWGESSLESRYKVLNKIADLIEQKADFFAEAESIDNGKPLKLCKLVDIPRAVQNFRFFATSLLHFSSESHEMPNEAINYTLRQPIGTVGCISPWNLPLYLFSWKIAPALAMGNCVIAKPSEITPMTAFLLSEICIEAGLPAGVLNIIHGYGNTVGDSIVTHQQIKAISFTGGTSTGAILASKAAPMFKKMSLELGGKNPNIIFADCNYEEMLKTTILSSFSNQGQICLCGSRIFIERPIYEKFKKDFIDKVSNLKVGNPFDSDSRIGAIVSEQHFNKILNYIDLAKSEGGTILYGGNKVNLDGDLSNGYYIQPTVIEGLSFDCRTNQEEIFGPVVTITPFDTEEEVLLMANSTQYGLSASIWTENLSRANRLSRYIQAGIVWINCWLLRDLRTPFGGTKNSGVGREGGLEAMRFFSEPKNICIKYY